MLVSRSPPWALIFLIVSSLTLPPAFAHGPGDHAQAEVHATNSAAALCQLLVLVDALIILEAEDSLGLIASPPSEPALVDIPVQALQGGAVADCSVVIDELSVRFPSASSPLLARSNYVSGPPSILATGGTRPGLEWNVNVTGAGSEARVCQVVIILGSIIVGGAAFGIDPGDLPIIDFNAVGEGSGPEGDATCRAAVGDLRIDGESLGPVEASA